MSEIISPDGNKLYYETHGTGQPLLLIHGFASDISAFRNQIDAFSKKYKVILPDLPGHGKSAIPHKPLNSELFARYIKAVIDNLSFDIGHLKLAVLGWSMGGRVALKLWELHKELISKMILVGTTPHYLKTKDFPHGMPRKFFEDLRQKIKDNPERGLNYFRNLVFAKGKSSARRSPTCPLKLQRKREGEGGPKELKHVFYDTSKNTINALMSALNSLEFEDMRSILCSINVPTLLIHGEIDQVCYKGTSEYMAEHITGSKLVIIPDAAHAPFLTKPGKFNKMILEFLKKNDR
ncbi:MAG: alpha/beta hydrolase [bacterium]